MKKSFDSLIALTKDKIKLLIKVEEINLMQQQLLKENDLHEFIVNIDERQNIIDDLIRLDEAIRITHKEVEAEIGKESSIYPYQITDLNDLKENVTILIKQIIESNQRIEIAVNKKINDLKINIKTINHNKKGLNAYSMMNSNLNSIYFDQTK